MENDLYALPIDHIPLKWTDFARRDSYLQFFRIQIDFFYAKSVGSF